MTAIATYRKKTEAYLTRVEEMNHVVDILNEQSNQHQEFCRKRLDEFLNGFNIITMKLKEMYRMITIGGDAELELIDSLNPFTEGIMFSVRPPNKSWKNISNLSGGEKTLSSLALVFALHHYRPSPFYVMDEIDAALDFKNVSIVGNYLKERTKDAQFIVISLRNNMYELADRLCGIYKLQNITYTITVDPAYIESMLQLQIQQQHGTQMPCSRPEQSHAEISMAPVESQLTFS
ncbi:Structural maintenance of chromosomes protein 4 [Cichlidogyrus casuarinus]|uniref:Structural maintenance of chromosomes protein 4 n=1 Tax=Cichlidogyrus casuarinus TaxID=1844966 RepID=A0ABD2Q7F9_9PLAT